MNIDQIAAEAATAIQGWIESDSDPWLPDEVKKTTAIIKAAIEKAYNQGGVDREREIYGLKDRAAHASDPWTPNYVARLYAFAYGNEHSQRIAAMTKTFVTGWQAIADAHNASIGVKPAHASEPLPIGRTK